MAVNHPRVGLNRHRVITHAATEFGQNETGGVILQLRAGAALDVGEAVVIDANGECVTSGTAADGLKFAGIVVGGRQTDMKALLDDSHVATLAANADETVLVMVHGIAYAVADDTITRGARVGLGATAGQLDDATLSYHVGVALEAGTAGNPFLVLLNGISVEV